MYRASILGLRQAEVSTSTKLWRNMLNAKSGRGRHMLLPELRIELSICGTRDRHRANSLMKQ